MTEREIRLVNIINAHDNPEKALLAAIEIISNYLEQQKSSEEQVPVGLPEPA